MKTKQKAPKEHGIISIVQSPNEGIKANKLSTENYSVKQKKHGIISIVQSPVEVKNKEKSKIT